MNFEKGRGIFLFWPGSVGKKAVEHFHHVTHEIVL